MAHIMRLAIGRLWVVYGQSTHLLRDIFTLRVELCMGVNLVIGRLRVREEGQARIVLDEKV